MMNADLPAMPNDIMLDDAADLGCGGTVAEFARFRCGLTKREHFAAMAMQGLLSNDEAVQRMTRAGETNLVDASILVADAAIQMADTLLEELDKQK